MLYIRDFIIILSIFIYILSLVVLQNVKYFDPTLPSLDSSSTTASTTSTTSTTTTTTTTTTTKAHLKWEEYEDVRLKLVHEIGDSPGNKFSYFRKVYLG